MWVNLSRVHTVIPLEQPGVATSTIGTAMLNGTSTPDTPRQVLVFRVSGHRQQQHVLIALSEVDVPGVSALGTFDGCWLVVLGCATFGSQVRARQVVLAIDPRATCSSRRRPSHHVRIDPAGSA